MRNLLQLSLKLMAFTLVAGLLLALTNAVTSGPIAEQQARTENASRYAVMPDAESFERIEDDAACREAAPSLTAIYRALKGEETVGYTLNLAPSGYKDIIGMTVGISAAGAVTGVTIDSQAETQGVGSKVTDEAFLGQFVGQPASSEALETGVDTITGATVSSSTVKKAVQSAAAVSETVLGIEPHAATPMAAEDEFRLTTLPGASGFEAIDLLSFLGDYDTIKGIKAAYSGDKLMGYSFDITAQGYGGDINMTLGIAVESETITGLEIAPTNESADYGKRIEEEEYYGQYAGLALTDEALASVDGVSGATATSNTVMRSVRQAVSFYRQYLGGGGEPTTLDDADDMRDITARMQGSEDSYPLIEKVEEALYAGEAIGYRFTTAPTSDSSGLTLDVMAGRVVTAAYRGTSETDSGLDSVIGEMLLPEPITDALSSASWASDSLREALGQCASFYDAYISGSGAPATLDDADDMRDITARMQGSEDSYPLIEKVEEALYAGEAIGYRFTTAPTSDSSGLTLDVMAGRVVTAAYRGTSETDSGLDSVIGEMLLPEPITDALSSASWASDSLREALGQCASFYDAYISGEEAAA